MSTTLEGAKLHLQNIKINRRGYLQRTTPLKKEYPVVIKVEYWRKFKNGKVKHKEIDYKYPKYGFQFYKKITKKASESEKFVLKEAKMWNFKPGYEPLLVSRTLYAKPI